MRKLSVVAAIKPSQGNEGRCRRPMVARPADAVDEDACGHEGQDSTHALRRDNLRAKPSETLNCLAMSGMAGTMIPRPKLMSVDGRKTWKMGLAWNCPRIPYRRPCAGRGWPGAPMPRLRW